MNQLWKWLSTNMIWFFASLFASIITIIIPYIRNMYQSHKKHDTQPVISWQEESDIYVSLADNEKKQNRLYILTKEKNDSKNTSPESSSSHEKTDETVLEQSKKSKIQSFLLNISPETEDSLSLYSRDTMYMLSLLNSPMQVLMAFISCIPGKFWKGAKKLFSYLLPFLVTLGIATLCVIGYFQIILANKSYGQLSLNISNISCINKLSSDSIIANLPKNPGNNQTAKIYISDEIVLTSENTFLALDQDNTMIDVDEIYIKPINETSSITLDNDDAIQLLFEINARCVQNTDSQSHLFYSTYKEDQYAYIITAPEITCNIHLPYNRNSYAITTSDCELIYYFENKKVGTGSYVCFPAVQSNNQRIINFMVTPNHPESSFIGFSYITKAKPDSIQPSDKKATNIHVLGLQELDLNCSGSLSWRYDVETQETLHDDRIQFVVDRNKSTPVYTEPLIQQMVKELSFASHDIEFKGTKANATLITQAQIDRSVKQYYLDSIEQLPNFRSFILKNWSGGLIMSFFLSIIEKHVIELLTKKKENKQKLPNPNE